MTKEKIYHIPTNCTTGIPVLGRTVPVRNAAEALLTALAGAGTGFLLRSWIGMRGSVTAALCSAVLSAALILPGWDGVSVFARLSRVIAFFRSRRTCTLDPPRQTPQPAQKEKKKDRPHPAVRKPDRKEEDVLEHLILPMRSDDQ